MNAYMIVGPTNRKPRFARSFDSASDCARARRDRRERAVTIHDRLAVDELPDVAVERPVLALQREERARIRDGAVDLQSIADDAGVRHQAFDLCGRRSGRRAPDRTRRMPRDRRRACSVSSTTKDRPERPREPGTRRSADRRGPARPIRHRGRRRRDRFRLPTDNGRWRVAIWRSRERTRVELSMRRDTRRQMR